VLRELHRKRFEMLGSNTNENRCNLGSKINI
jgi:hypothetical protein